MCLDSNLSIASPNAFASSDLSLTKSLVSSTSSLVIIPFLTKSCNITWESTRATSVHSATIWKNQAG